MQHLRSLWDASIQQAWLAIGAFDGLHRGHQKIIQEMVSSAHLAGNPAVVLTFFPHPGFVLGFHQGDFFLTTVEERAEILGDWGVDFVITHPFDVQFAKTTARDFVLALKDKLGLSQLWVGPDFTLGHGKEGTVPRLEILGSEIGFEVHLVEKEKEGGDIISSSRIRSLLVKGDVKQARDLIGRFYRVSGRVVPGDQRGRTIGIPTANLEIEPGKLKPGGGVYACQASLRDRIMAAAVNIGTRPTFHGSGDSIHLEAHLLDYHGDEFYDQVLTLDFVERLRGEVKFATLPALIEQIHHDIALTRKIVELNG
jgi:riboflavin kinase/FMN adenylyltransferase